MKNGLIMHDDVACWYKDDKLHREDEPAVAWTDGCKYWFIDGKLLTKEEFNKHPKVVAYKVNKQIKELLDD